MRIKICGITQIADALTAVDAGADAIGLNFIVGPRQIAEGPAAEILAVLPPMVVPVALVRLQEGRIPDSLVELLGRFWVSHLQVYGNVTTESLATLKQDGFHVMPVLPVRNESFTSMADNWLQIPDSRPDAIVLDAYHPIKEGGTGMTFRWSWIPAARSAGLLQNWPPLVLAGGLTPDNVDVAVRVVRPYAVDVSSGVEIVGRPGRKDPDKVRQFVDNARAALAMAERESQRK